MTWRIKTNFSICKTALTPGQAKKRQMSIGCNQNDFTAGQTTFNYSTATIPPNTQPLGSTALIYPFKDLQFVICLNSARGEACPHLHRLSPWPQMESKNASALIIHMYAYTSRQRSLGININIIFVPFQMRKLSSFF